MTLIDGNARLLGAISAAEVRRQLLAADVFVLASWHEPLGVAYMEAMACGVPTIGTDAGQAGTFDPPFPNHTIMHGAGKFGLASLCNLDQLPPTGAVVIAAPLKIVDGSRSPLRVLALSPA